MPEHSKISRNRRRRRSSSLEHSSLCETTCGGQLQLQSPAAEPVQCVQRIDHVTWLPRERLDYDARDH